MPKRGIVTRKTEIEALEPGIVNRCDTRFTAPYGTVSGQIVSIREQEAREQRRARVDAEAEMLFGFLNKYLSQDQTPVSEEADLLTDQEIIDKAGVWKNERHTHMMERDFIAPHERRFEAWTVQEAIDYHEQLEKHVAWKLANKASAASVVEFGYLNTYMESCMQESIPEFETLDMDGPEIIPESQSNSMSLIFTSTGKTYRSSKVAQEICVPLGDNGNRKELPSYAYRTVDAEDFTPCKVTIPEYVPREDWLKYCLRKII